MRDRDVDLAILMVRKDALLADRQLGLALWHAVEGAGLAVPGFATLGFLQGSVTPLAFAGVLILALGTVLLGERGASRQRKSFDRQLHVLIRNMETLKSGGEP